jgi:hypothetical protein
MGIFMHDFGAFLHRGIRCKHRVDRVLGFLSGRPNWLPPPLHPQASVAPLWFQWGGGGGTHSLEGEGAGGAHSEEGTDSLVL